MKRNPPYIEPLEARIAPAFAAVFELSSLNGLNGFRISGAVGDDFSGDTVSDAGDVNGDGFGDLIIGAYGADPNGENSGASYVIFGKAGGFSADLNLLTLDERDGFRISGVAPLDNSGEVSAAGDVNGDGFGDLIIGAPGPFYGSNIGLGYVVFGKASGFGSNLELSTLDGSNGFRLNGVAPGDGTGYSASRAGDFNGDGFDDVIIGAHNALGTGASYLVFGRASGFAANLDLLALDGNTGFRLSGVSEADETGFSVGGGGDFNGDGFDDLIICAYWADPSGSRSGANYVVFGKADGFGGNLKLSTLDGTNGFQLSGVAPYDFSGRSVSNAGDVNGDGFDDLIIGAYGADPNGLLSGASYVVFGKGSGFARNVNLSTLDGSNGFKLSGVAPNDYSGFSVSGAGDVNGDGFADLIIGAPLADPNGSRSGASYVVFGKAGGFAANLELSMLDGTDGFKLNGVARIDQSGRSVSSAGDINADGFDDIIIGARRADASASNSGASYVVFGRDATTPFVSIGDAALAEGDAGTTVLMFPVTLSSASAQPVTVQYSTANGSATELEDYIALPLATLVFDPGELSKMVTVLINADIDLEPNETFFVHLSNPTNAVFADASGLISILDDDTAVLELAALDGRNGFKINGVAAKDNFGFSVSDAGDVNGDGVDDLIIGAYGADPNGNYSGASYVIFGDRDGFPANVDPSQLNGANGFRIDGDEGDYSGVAVHGAGDVNGDGFDDLLIGAPQADSNGNNRSGASYVVFGKSSGFEPAFQLSILTGLNGFKINGAAAGDSSGWSVSAAGDVNGDGLDDVLIGAYRADPSNVGALSGASYVVFGRSEGFGPTVELSTLDGLNGFRIDGEAAADLSGLSLSGGGDVNGDGFDDVIIGAFGSDAYGEGGASYIVFGKAGGFSASLAAADLDGSNGFKIYGAAFGDSLGSSVSGAGDVNGDGVDDLLIAARDADSNGAESGSTYVVFGTTLGFTTPFDLTLLDGTNGFRIDGETVQTYSGYSVSAAGDVNGDGFDDVLIGASRADPNGAESGASYLIFGKAAAFSPSINLGKLDGANGFKIIGVAAGDYAGRSVSGAGDVNGDGFDDLLIGAPQMDYGNSADKGGVAYVIFGRQNEGDIEVRVTDAIATEGDSGTAALAFTVALSKAAKFPVSVELAAIDSTARAGVDYTQPEPVLTFAPGETSKTITILVVSDTLHEANETFSVVLSHANGATIGVGTAIGAIINDDLPPLVSITGERVLEGDAGRSSLLFTVTLSTASGLPVIAQYATSDDTALGGSDYTPLSPATLTFAPGEINKSLTVEVLTDTRIEGHEQFSMILADVSGATIGSAIATGTILNDDTPLVRIEDVPLLEAHSGVRAMLFSITLSAAAILPVSVNFTTVDGFARNGTDYTAPLSGSVDFAPGETSKTLAIDVRGDIAVEPSETFSIVLADASNAVIEDGTALGTILDDDVTLQGKRKATFSDVDGDRVTIKVNKGTLKVEDFTIVPSGSGAQLALIDFRDEAQFAGANLRITAKGVAGVASLVDVGHINATGIDLGKVVVKGDLGQIDAGNATDRKPGLLSLRANSLGLHGIETQLPGGSMQSDIVGALKTFQLLAGIHHATLLVSGSIGAVSVGGDWIASNLAAGATAGPDGFFGTEDDAPMPTPPSSSISRIASILIKGTASGTEGGTDHFGFVAAQVGAFAAGGSTVPLTRGANNDLAGLPVGVSGDITVRELA